MNKKFNFLEIIFELSETKNKDELPNEWEFIIRHECVNKSKTCVCNCKIKNYSIFINRLNKHFIYCGDCCRKQLNLKCSKENVIFRLFNHHYPKQQYDIIKDIFKYSCNVIYNFINDLDNMKYHKLHKMKDLIEHMILNKDDIHLDKKTEYTLLNLFKKIEWYEMKLAEKRDHQEKEIKTIKDVQNQIIKEQNQQKIFEEQQALLVLERALRVEQQQKMKTDYNNMLFKKYHVFLSNILEEHEYIKQSRSKELYKYSEQFKTKEKELIKIERVFNTHYEKFISSFDIKRYVSWNQFSDEDYCFCYIKNSFFEKFNKQFYSIDQLMNIRNIVYAECKCIIDEFKNVV